MTAEKIKPLPCPFCGKAPKIEQVSVGYFMSFCSDDECIAGDDNQCLESEQAAIDFWNRRKPE